MSKIPVLSFYFLRTERVDAPAFKTNRFPVHQRGAISRGVLAFTVHHWHRQPARLAIIMAAMLASTLADALMPIYSGRLIDAVAAGAAVAAPTWDSALAAFSVPIALALAAIAMRHIAFIGITDLLLKMMSDVATKRSIMSSAFRQTGMRTPSPARQCAR